jgi:hypothetical protein
MMPRDMNPPDDPATTAADAEILQDSFDYIIALETSGRSADLAAAIVLRENFDAFVAQRQVEINKRGVNSWHIDQRDELLRHLHRRMTAEAIHAQWSRYASTGWKHDRIHGHDYKQDDPRYTFYKMLKHHDFVPKQETIERMFRK